MILLLVIAAVVTLLCVTIMSSFLSDGTRTEVAYSDFIQMVKDGKVESVVIREDEIQITPKNGYSVKSTEDSPFYYLQTESYYTVKVEDPDLTQILLDNGVEVRGKKPSANSTLLDMSFGLRASHCPCMGIPDVYV